MRRKQVQSSTLRSVGYYRDEKILELEFTSREVYQYMDVPEDVYKELLDAPSHGRYFNNAIKDEYECEKIGRRQAANGRRSNGQ